MCGSGAVIFKDKLAFKYFKMSGWQKPEWTRVCFAKFLSFKANVPQNKYLVYRDQRLVLGVRIRKTHQ